MTETTMARCGHAVPAVGLPGSIQRRAAERRTCGHPRCASGLPAKFTDEECAAFVWLTAHGIKGFTIDGGTKTVVAFATNTTPRQSFPTLAEYAKSLGM